MATVNLAAAQAYNKSKSGVLWNLADLPWPYKSNNPSTSVFAQLIAAFQQDHALKVDGCLGPATLATLRVVMAEGLPASDTQTVDGPVVKPKTLPGRLGVSNVIIINGVQIATPFSCSNYLLDDEPRFKCRTRTKSPTHICIHESVTRDAATAIRVLQRDDYGVHLVICPDGHVSQHNDLVLDQPAHANQLNGCSIGLEIINPYSPLFAKPPYTKTIVAKWWTWIPEGGSKQYTLPTDAQMETLKILIPWLATVVPTIPLKYPTKDLNSKNTRIKDWKTGAKPAPGIVAHQDFSSHSDGRYELEMLFGES